MKRFGFVVVSLLNLVACGAPNNDVQRTEILFWHSLARKEAASLESFLLDCECQQGNFVTLECQEAAALVQLVRARADWHRQASLSALGLGETPNYPPPPILAGGLLCIR